VTADVVDAGMEIFEHALTEAERKV
jgi:hypothetical protein